MEVFEIYSTPEEVRKAFPKLKGPMIIAPRDVWQCEKCGRIYTTEKEADKCTH